MNEMQLSLLVIVDWLDMVMLVIDRVFKHKVLCVFFQNWESEFYM